MPNDTGRYWKILEDTGTTVLVPKVLPLLKTFLQYIDVVTRTQSFSVVITGGTQSRKNNTQKEK